MLIDDEPWFVGKDVAGVLGYSNARKAIIDHINEDDKGVTNCDTLGGVQNLTIINESGLYSLILSSKLPTAKSFKHWVTSEVLPSIRKTGTYKLKRKRKKPIDIIFKQSMNMAKALSENTGVKEGIALAIAIERTEELTGEDLTAFKRLLPPAEHETGFLSSSMIGEKIGILARKVNVLLTDNGFQYKYEKGQ